MVIFWSLHLQVVCFLLNQKSSPFIHFLMLILLYLFILVCSSVCQYIFLIFSYIYIFFFYLIVFLCYILYSI